MAPNAADLRPWPASTADWLRLALGLASLFALFEGSGALLHSDRGQAGLAVGALVIGATLVVSRLLFDEPLAVGVRHLGLGAPRARGIVAALICSGLLILVLPSYIISTGASWTMYPGWVALLPGLFAQAGIAEEVLFRGFLYGRLRHGRSFWSAAILASLPFICVHLGLFFTLSWAVALMSIALAAVLSFPLAYLYELSGRTIWAPAIVHWVVQGAIKVIVFAGAGSSFPAVWIASAAAIPLIVFVFRESAHRGDTRVDAV